MNRMRLPLDLQLFAQEKTERATPKKRQEARKKGQVASSQELPGAVIMVLVFLSFMMLGGYYKTRIVRLFGLIFEQRLTMEVTAGNVMALFSNLMIQCLLLLAPIFVIAVASAVIANYIQVGLLFTGEGFKINLNKINPLNGFKQIFSLRSLFDLAKSIAKLIVIGAVVYFTLWRDRATIMKLAEVPVDGMLAFIANLTIRIGLEIGVLLVVLAVVDYFYQRFQHEKSLRMSKQDIKDEYKKTEGDPLIKGKIRERQRRMALQRMMQEVPKADVVITNPTHFAVALQYDGSRMEAPVVIAKGMDYVALRIKEIAGEHGVTTMENRPLARALYDRTEIGDAIPSDLFQAVAEVLAYVYKLKRKTN
ncbi:flagellar biosynthesis protein FlhB [Paenibacillus humicola]|uniref:flagellar biosynthesis protein FlhB n=1 Tax=Paenibacillus humicola TaxID=3110540 RepID=UPI00237B8F0F|nr:flagellar biosynthesis protein FlhB [Paenibacillus humicola]